MSRLALILLGSPRTERDGAPVRMDRRKAVALIAYLAMMGESHSRDTLATLLWPEQDQSRARAGLRAALSTLKRALGDGWLDVDRESVGLNPDITPLASDLRSASGQELWLDVAEFRGNLAECRTHGHPEKQVCPDCLPTLAEAAELYRDDFLAGFTNDLRYVDIAHQALAQMQSMMSQYPLGFGQWLQALSYALSKPREIAIVGDPDSTDTEALLNVVRDGYRPFQVVALGSPDDGTAADGVGSIATVPLLQDRGLVEGQAAAYVCRAFACQAPVTGPLSLEQLLGVN